MRQLRLSSRSTQKITKNLLPQPLANGIMVSAKIVSREAGKARERSFTSIESTPSIIGLESDGAPFSAVVGRLELPINPYCRSPHRSALSVYTGSKTVEIIVRAVYRNLKRELGSCQTKEKKRKGEIIDNVRTFCLDGMGELGIPKPSHALSFIRSAEMVSRIAGIFIFRPEGERTSYEFIPLGRGSMVFCDDQDGNPYLDLRNTGLIKITPDQKLFFGNEELAFFDSIGIPPTIGGLGMLAAKPNWRSGCPDALERQINVLALSHNIALAPRSFLPSIPSSQDVTKVEPKFEAMEGPTDVDLVWEEK